MANAESQLFKVQSDKIRQDQLEQKYLPKDLEHVFIAKRFNSVVDIRDKQIAEFEDAFNKMYQ